MIILDVPAINPEPTPFQKFEALARRVMSVPKAEIDRRTKAAQIGGSRKIG
jgi:hypothetical protein